MAWDRYSYTYNNPINFTDPSGHNVCSDDGYCGKLKDRNYWNKIVNSFENDYGVLFTGQWEKSLQSRVMIGVMQVGQAIYDHITTIGRSVGGVFSDAFGRIVFSLDDKIGYFGLTQSNTFGSKLSFHPERITSRLVGHELGHAFVNRYYQKSGNQYTDSNPEQMLISGGVYSLGGTKITGKYDAKGNYDRYAGRVSPINGYCSDGYADQCQYHSRDVDGWNNASEDFADMFMNWAFGTFEANEAGSTLNNWVNSNMPQWN